MYYPDIPLFDSHIYIVKFWKASKYWKWNWHLPTVAARPYGTNHGIEMPSNVVE